jgi:DNA-binding CsgD family transcriptional regulator
MSSDSKNSKTPSLDSILEKLLVNPFETLTQNKIDEGELEKPILIDSKELQKARLELDNFGELRNPRQLAIKALLTLRRQEICCLMLFLSPLNNRTISQILDITIVSVSENRTKIETKLCKNGYCIKDLKKILPIPNHPVVARNQASLKKRFEELQSITRNTETEIQVLHLANMGYSDTKIEDVLELKPNSASRILIGIKRKLGHLEELNIYPFRKK